MSVLVGSEMRGKDHTSPTGAELLQQCNSHCPITVEAGHTMEVGATGWKEMVVVSRIAST